MLLVCVRSAARPCLWEINAQNFFTKPSGGLVQNSHRQPVAGRQQAAMALEILVNFIFQKSFHIDAGL